MIRLVVLVVVCLPAAAALGERVVLVDPRGDDDGPGSYTYPTDPVYTPGSFDLTRFEVVPRGEVVELRITVAAKIEDPWNSRSWNGNGFSVQMVFVHIDVDHAPGSGVTAGVPGTNVQFTRDEAWDRVVVVSPQPAARLRAEIDGKAALLADRIVVPRRTRASGRTLIAVVDAAALGGRPRRGWGWQVLMQSNEGFPERSDLLTRKVNREAGQHRFGGGTDFDADPHVIDILAPPGRTQHEILSAYRLERYATVPMVYPR